MYTGDGYSSITCFGVITGFKLFYKNDKPMMTPKQVIELYPSPVYIQYQ